MGDRCYVRITVEKARMEEFETLMFGYLGGGPVPEEEDDLTATYDLHEVNYAAYDTREQAAKAGILFYGYNGAGSEYPSAEFCSSDGESMEWTTAGPHDRYVLYADDDGNVSDEAQEDLKRYIAAYRRTKSMMHNPLHRLVAAT